METKTSKDEANAKSAGVQPEVIKTPTATISLDLMNAVIAYLEERPVKEVIRIYEALKNEVVVK